MRAALILTTPLVALVLTAVTHPPAKATSDHAQRRVQFEGPVERTVAPQDSSTLAYKFSDLFKISPDHPLADKADSQTLSLFGREDLIATTSNDFRSLECRPLVPQSDVLTTIEAAARNTSIVIINESHERSEYRGFTTEVAKRLRPLGYDTLAMETLSNSPPGAPEKTLPVFVRQPDLPYLVDDDGYYLSEAGFGRLGRAAKSLGYRLLGYEPNEDMDTRATLPREEQVALREEGQARNLAAFAAAHPKAKLLVHVGYSHAAEVPQQGDKWMALRLKQKTGIDPLTISQISCRGGQTLALATLPDTEPAGTFDLVVDHPQARFARHRPVWRQAAGDQLVSIPPSLRPRTGWRVIEARPIAEPSTSVPMDRVAIRPGEDVALSLPPGRYHLRVVDPGHPATASEAKAPS